MIDAKDVKKVLDLLADEKQIRELISSLHKDAIFLYENFSENALDFYYSLNKDLKEKMAEAIVNKLNN